VIDLASARQALRERGLGAWVLYDFRGSNPVLWHVLGTEPLGTTRRVLLIVGAEGEPVLVASALDRDLLAERGVALAVYRRWEELVEELRSRLGGAGRVAMEYSPGGALPAVSWVDAGTVELVRSLGVEVVSSAELFQEVAAAWDEAAEASHHEAVRHVMELHALAREQAPGATELAVARRVLDEIAARGLETEGSPGIAVGPNSGNPHHEPGDAPIGPGEVLLIDIWARLPGERNVFGDVTWMSFTGPEAPARVREAFAAVAAGRDAALALVRERRDHELRGFEVDRACRAAIEVAGFGHGLVHRTGHSLGPGPRVHGLGANLDDWETHDDRPLVPGIGFTVEPGVYLPEFGVRLECDVHLHPQRGPAVTTPLQTELTLLH
jgi:Xaa-Pro aminopeptidase